MRPVPTVFIARPYHALVHLIDKANERDNCPLPLVLNKDSRTKGSTRPMETNALFIDEYLVTLQVSTTRADGGTRMDPIHQRI